LVKKKRKKLERGEVGMYDPDQARAQEDNAADKELARMKKSVGVQWPKKKNGYAVQK